VEGGEEEVGERRRSVGVDDAHSFPVPPYRQPPLLLLPPPLVDVAVVTAAERARRAGCGEGRMARSHERRRRSALLCASGGMRREERRSTTTTTAAANMGAHDLEMHSVNFRGASLSLAPLVRPSTYTHAHTRTHTWNPYLAGSLKHARRST